MKSSVEGTLVGGEVIGGMVGGGVLVGGGIVGGGTVIVGMVNVGGGIVGGGVVVGKLIGGIVGGGVLVGKLGKSGNVGKSGNPGMSEGAGADVPGVAEGMVAGTDVDVGEVWAFAPDIISPALPAATAPSTATRRVQTRTPTSRSASQQGSSGT